MKIKNRDKKQTTNLECFRLKAMESISLHEFDYLLFIKGKLNSTDR